MFKTIIVLLIIFFLYRFGCHKCLCRSKNINRRQVYCNVNSLTTRNQDDDTGFYMMPSPLRDIEVDLVHEVVVEPMHMIYLGKIL